LTVHRKTLVVYLTDGVIVITLHLQAGQMIEVVASFKS